jgi:hypothetical protein
MPSEIGSLTDLVDFVVPKMQLHGTILDHLHKMNKLRKISLPKNDFVGSIPDSFASDHPVLKHLELSDNSFVGLVLSSLGNIPTLETLLLSNNGFEGQIPGEFSQISVLSKYRNLQSESGAPILCSICGLHSLPQKR